ncbi:hypothetical protein JCM3770_003627 [Rhodotorula araucariae]
MAHASTSHSRDSPPSSEGPGTKRKRLPACDCCKMRRLKCEPVPPPGSCSRCKTTGVVCTTTPVVRKKALPRTGKRIEEAKATFGTADPDAPDFMGASNTPWVQPRHPGGGETLATGVHDPKISDADVNARLASRELDGALVAHLLELYQTFPQSWLPIGVRGRVAHQFDAVGRRLEALPPQTEVLALVTIALTARLSSHPALFEPGQAVPPHTALTPAVLASQPDLREFGQRREGMCEELRRRAVDMAWRRGTMVRTCEDSMASCYLLEMLEGRNEPAVGKPYGSAFVSHLQTIINGQDAPGATLKVMNMSLGWSALIMREALYAANTGRTSHFTATDDLLLCGEVPISIEETLLESVDDVDVRDSVTLFFRPMRPFTYHVARLARECGAKISGTAARRQPFDEKFAAKYLTQLDHLLHLFAILESRIAYVLSPAATAAHSLPAPFETERTFIMRACLHTLGLAWAALSLPVYNELARRLAALRGDEDAPGPVAASANAVAAAERRRTRERLELLQRQVSGTAVKAARIVAQCVHEAPSLAFLTQLQSENLDRWVEVLLDAQVSEDGGGEGITHEEKETSLRWLLDGLKTMGWSWTDGAPLIATIEAALGEATVDTAYSGTGSEAGSAHSYAHQPEGNLPSPRAAMRASAAPAAFSSSPFAAGGGDEAYAPPPPPPQPALSAPQASALIPAAMGDAFLMPGSANALQPSPATYAAPPLSTLFAGAPTPPAPPQAQAPDLSTLMSLYSSGALDPLLASAAGAGMDVGALASQYFAGTLDVGSLLGAAGAAGVAIPGFGAPMQPQQGAADPGEFDLESLLAEPVFAATPGA